MIAIGVQGRQLFPFKENYKENIKIFFFISDFRRTVAFRGEAVAPPSLPPRIIAYDDNDKCLR